MNPLLIAAQITIVSLATFNVNAASECLADKQSLSAKIAKVEFALARRDLSDMLGPKTSANNETKSHSLATNAPFQQVLNVVRIEKPKTANVGFKDSLIFGFNQVSHRLEKVKFHSDTSIILKACDKVLKKMGVHNPLLEIAQRLEEVALQESYFIEKKLDPNVDYNSGIIACSTYP